MTNPRIWIGCLASYNNGVLHGAWIDVDGLDEDDIRQAIETEVLRPSPYPNTLIACPDCDGPQPSIWAALLAHRTLTVRLCLTCKGRGLLPSAEEWAVHDYDEFGSIGDSLGEHPALGDLVLHATMLAKHEDAWEAYVQWGKGEFTEEDFDECYRGHYDSPGDFAEEFITDVYDLSELPQVIRFHVDWDGIARDMRLGGDQYFSEDDGPCHVFDNY